MEIPIQDFPGFIHTQCIIANRQGWRSSNLLWLFASCFLIIQTITIGHVSFNTGWLLRLFTSEISLRMIDIPVSQIHELIMSHRFNSFDVGQSAILTRRFTQMSTGRQTTLLRLLLIQLIHFFIVVLLGLSLQVAPCCHFRTWWLTTFMILNIFYQLFSLLAFHLPIEHVVVRFLRLQFLQHRYIFLRYFVLNLFLTVPLHRWHRQSILLMVRVTVSRCVWHHFCILCSSIERLMCTIHDIGHFWQ